jgi:hypothetical protein
VICSSVVKLLLSVCYSHSQLPRSTNQPTTMAITKEQKKQRLMVKNLKLQKQVEAGNYQGLYLYMPLASMSVTKDTVAVRPVVIVASDEELGHLVVPYSRNKLREVDHLPVVLPHSKKESYLAPNEASWLIELPKVSMQRLHSELWQQTLANLVTITKVCKRDSNVNASLNDWLTKAIQAGLS